MRTWWPAIDAVNQAKANLDVILDVISRAIVLGGAHGRSGRGRMVVVCALRACVAAEHAAQDLFQRGELLSALALIGAVDTRCRCSRFTSGDAPHITPRPISPNC